MHLKGKEKHVRRNNLKTGNLADLPLIVQSLHQVCFLMFVIQFMQDRQRE